MHGEELAVALLPGRRLLVGRPVLQEEVREKVDVQHDHEPLHRLEEGLQIGDEIVLLLVVLVAQEDRREIRLPGDHSLDAVRDLLPGLVAGRAPAVADKGLEGRRAPGVELRILFTPFSRDLLI